MINELIEQIGGRERLQEIYADGFLKHGESKLMAHALLAVLDAPKTECEKLKYIRRLERKLTTSNALLNEASLSLLDKHNSPPAASVPDVNFDLSKPGTEATVITHYQVPDGWKLVPIEPSKEMLLASKRYKAKTKVPTGPGVYRAMIAAAPAQGGDGG